MSDLSRKQKILQPIIPNELMPMNFEDRDDTYVSVALISDCSIVGEEIERLKFEQVVFQNVTFIDVSFRYVELIDVIFERCDLSNSNFGDASIHRVEFKESK